MFDFDDILNIGEKTVEFIGDVAETVTDHAVEVIKEEGPHILHKAGEVIEEIIKNK